MKWTETVLVVQASISGYAPDTHVDPVEASVLEASFSIPANRLRAKMALQITVAGKATTYSTGSTYLRVYLGGIKRLEYSLGSSLSSKPFRLDAAITIQTAGASGSLQAAGVLYKDIAFPVIDGDAAQPSLDTTAANTLDVKVALPANGTGENIEVSTYVVTLVEAP